MGLDLLGLDILGIIPTKEHFLPNLQCKESVKKVDPALTEGSEATVCYQPLNDTHPLPVVTEQEGLRGL